MNASSTGNIYGIYDLSGGEFECVMGNMSSESGSYIYYVSQAGSNFIYDTNTAKYIDTYSFYIYSITNGRARLGDATGEILLSSGTWDSEYDPFVYKGTPWFHRGGWTDSGSDAGVFNFGCTTAGDCSARIFLIVY